MSGRFDYVKYDDQAILDQSIFKQKFQELDGEIEYRLMSSRPMNLALTHLEIAYMWIGKAIRDDQIERNGSAQLQEERGNE